MQLTVCQLVTVWQEQCVRHSCWPFSHVWLCQHCIVSQPWQVYPVYALYHLLVGVFLRGSPGRFVPVSRSNRRLCGVNNVDTCEVYTRTLVAAWTSYASVNKSSSEGGLLNPSARALACDHSGVNSRCFTPHCFRNFHHAKLLNSDPLSDLIISR